MVIMAKRLPYILIYAPSVKQHLRVIDFKYRSLIRENIEKQLIFDPNVETRNRKPLHDLRRSRPSGSYVSGRTIDFASCTNSTSIGANCPYWLWVKRREAGCWWAARRSCYEDRVSRRDKDPFYAPS